MCLCKWPLMPHYILLLWQTVTYWRLSGFNTFSLPLSCSPNIKHTAKLHVIWWRIDCVVQPLRFTSAPPGGICVIGVLAEASSVHLYCFVEVVCSVDGVDSPSRLPGFRKHRCKEFIYLIGHGLMSVNKRRQEVVAVCVSPMTRHAPVSLSTLCVCLCLHCCNVDTSLTELNQSTVQLKLEELDPWLVNTLIPTQFNASAAFSLLVLRLRISSF